jgi:L-threonylcarbamoyladenylate synthase
MIVCSSLDDPQVAALLHQGKVGVIPTDTIYGVVANASNKQAVERLYELKQRRDDARSGTVIAANIQQLIDFGLDEAVVKSVSHLWPNPLSIELPLGDEFAYLFQSGPHRAFRVVADPKVARILEKTGMLLTSSANRTGDPPATTVDQAEDYFGDQVDFYVDGGDLSDRPPSTVAVIRGGKLHVVRPGAVTIVDE